MIRNRRLRYPSFRYFTWNFAISVASSRQFAVVIRAEKRTWVKDVWPIFPRVCSTAGASPSIASSSKKPPRSPIPRSNTQRIPPPRILHKSSRVLRSLSFSDCLRVSNVIRHCILRLYLSPRRRRSPCSEVCARSPPSSFSSLCNSSSSARVEIETKEIVTCRNVHGSYTRILHQIFGELMYLQLLMQQTRANGIREAWPDSETKRKIRTI